MHRVVLIAHDGKPLQVLEIHFTFWRELIKANVGDPQDKQHRLYIVVWKPHFLEAGIYPLSTEHGTPYRANMLHSVLRSNYVLLLFADYQCYVPKGDNVIVG
jgi:hypothetical protein